MGTKIPRFISMSFLNSKYAKTTFMMYIYLLNKLKKTNFSKVMKELDVIISGWHIDLELETHMLGGCQSRFTFTCLYIVAISSMLN